jgi:PadR family transcriptional regulator PadR
MGILRGRKQNEFLPGTLDLLILQTLSRGAMHGYGIAQLIRTRSEEVLQVGEGSLYPALQRLQVKGYVTAQWGQSETGRRARYYRLSRQGRRQLEAERASYSRVAEAIGRILQPV